MRLWTLLLFLGLCLALPGPIQGGFHADSDPESDWAEVPTGSGPDLGDLEFEAMVLPWSFFSALAEEENAMVIDVRTDFLGGPTPPGMETARPIPLEVFLGNFVARKANQDKILLIFDESGQTYLDLHRHLHEHGYPEYFFLSGGVENTLRLFGKGS